MYMRIRVRSTSQCPEADYKDGDETALWPITLAGRRDRVQRRKALDVRGAFSADPVSRNGSIATIVGVWPI